MKLAVEGNMNKLFFNGNPVMPEKSDNKEVWQIPGLSGLEHGTDTGNEANNNELLIKGEGGIQDGRTVAQGFAKCGFTKFSPRHPPPPSPPIEQHEIIRPVPRRVRQLLPKEPGGTGNCGGLLTFLEPNKNPTARNKTNEDTTPFPGNADHHYHSLLRSIANKLELEPFLFSEHLSSRRTSAPACLRSVPTDDSTETEALNGRSFQHHTEFLQQQVHSPITKQCLFFIDNKY